MSETLTAERLRELLHYNPETGVFTWRVNHRSVKAGSVTGCPSSSGYLRIVVDGRLYTAHRLAWLYEYGAWPKDQIDHVDGVRSNNAIRNLRSCTRAENMQNQRPPSTNSSGYLGVSWRGGSKPWRAQICWARRVINLGNFPTPEEAHEAYLKAKRELHTFQPVPRTTTTGATHAD
jgi:hypothetical protein